MWPVLPVLGVLVWVAANPPEQPVDENPLQMVEANPAESLVFFQNILFCAVLVASWAFMDLGMERWRKGGE